MARRQGGSVLDVLIAIAAGLPWQAGVILTLVSFFGFRAFAGGDVPTNLVPDSFAEFATRPAVKMIAGILQWVVSGAFMLGTLSSALARYRRWKIYGDVATAESAAVLSAIGWRDFERLVGDYFDHRGFKVRELGGSGADGGVDLIAQRGSDEYLIQCKQWKALRVGVVPVRELYGVMAARRAAGGFMVTSGTFTPEAEDFASGTSIELIDGAKLASAIARLGKSVQLPAAMPGRVEPFPLTSPLCPRCAAKMILRTARTGPSAGSQFWGCPSYPRCRGTRPAV